VSSIELPALYLYEAATAVLLEIDAARSARRQTRRAELAAPRKWGPLDFTLSSEQVEEQMGLPGEQARINATDSAKQNAAAMVGTAAYTAKEFSRCRGLVKMRVSAEHFIHLAEMYNRLARDRVLLKEQ